MTNNVVKDTKLITIHTIYDWKIEGNEESLAFQYLILIRKVLLRAKLRYLSNSSSPSKRKERTGPHFCSDGQCVTTDALLLNIYETIRHQCGEGVGRTNQTKSECISCKLILDLVFVRKSNATKQMYSLLTHDWMILVLITSKSVWLFFPSFHRRCGWTRRMTEILRSGGFLMTYWNYWHILWMQSK